MSTYKQNTPSHSSLPPSPTKSINTNFINPATSLYPSLPTEIIDSILGYLCLLQARNMTASALALATVPPRGQTGDETPLPPLRSLRRRASPTVALLPFLLVNSYFNRLAQRRLYAEVVTRGVKRCVLFMQTLLRSYNREKKLGRNDGEYVGGAIRSGGGKDRDTRLSSPLSLVKSFKLDISGEIGVLSGFYALLHRVLCLFSGLSTTISLVELHLDFPEAHSPVAVLEDCTPLLKRLKVFSTSMHCQRPLARALEQMDELRELTLRGFQREVDRSVFQVIGGDTDFWSSDDEETADEDESDDMDDDGNGDDCGMDELDEFEWGEFPRSVSGAGSCRRRDERRPTRAFYLPRKALRNLTVFNAIHSRPGIIREVLRGRDVKIVSVPVFSGLGIQTLDAVARAGKRREVERMRRRESRRIGGNGKDREMDGGSESLASPLPPPSVRRLSIISFDPESPAYLLPELVKRFGKPGWDVRSAPTPTKPRHSESGFGSASGSGRKSKKRTKTPTNGDGNAKQHSKCNTLNCIHQQAYTDPDPDDCQLEALHLVILLAECTTEMLEDNAKWLGAFQGLKNMTYMAASSNPRSPPAQQPPPPPMPAPALPPPPLNPHTWHSLSPTPFNVTPSTSLSSLATSTPASTPSSVQPPTSSTSSLASLPVASDSDPGADENMEGDVNANANGDSALPSDIEVNTGGYVNNATAEADENEDDHDHDTAPAPDPDSDHFLDDPEMTLDEAEIARMWHRACPSLETIILPMGKVWFKKL